MADLIKNPYVWLALFFLGGMVCSSRLQLAARRVNFAHVSDSESSPKLSSQAISWVIAAAFVIAFLYIARTASFQLSIATLLAGALYYWQDIYRRSIRPMALVGLPRSDSITLALMQVLWIGPLAVALALFIKAKYGAP